MAFKKGHKKIPGSGMKKGTVTKSTKATLEIRDMIKQALDGVGGVDYLMLQARSTPQSFMSLISKTIPAEIKGDIDKKVTIEIIKSF